HPELSAQAILIRESKKSRYVPIRQAPAQEWYDLSPSQRRSWLQEQLNTDAALPLNGMELFRLEGVLDRTSLEQAFSTLVDRHEILRTVIRQEQGQPPRQKVLPSAGQNFRVEYHDYRGEPEAHSQVIALGHRIRRTPFRFEEGP